MSQAQYTADIARLIQQQGAERAAAAERSGQVWGGALASLGQIPAQIQQQKQAQQQQALRGQEIAIRGQELDQRTKAFAQELIEKKQAHDDAAIGQIGSFIHESGNTLEALQSGLQSAKRAGLLSDEEIAPILAGAQEDPNRVKLLARGMMSRTKEGRDRMEKVTVYKPGEVGRRDFDNTELFKAPQAPPKNRSELAFDAANPASPTQAQSTTALDLSTPPKAEPVPVKKALQSENEWQVDGKSRPVIFDPESGARYLSEADVTAKKPIDPARLRKIPPASAGGPGSPAAGALDEDGLELAATSYRLTRQLPARNAVQNGAIISRAAKQAKELGNSPAAVVQRQAAYKSDAGSLDKMTKMADAAESFENKALGQIDIIKTLSPKVGRTNSPLLNSWLLAGKDHVMGDSETHQLFNAISTFSAEYAKLIEGSTGSAAGSSDSARKATERLVSAAQGKKSLEDTLNLMAREMRLTMGGYGATIAHITDRMGGTQRTPEQAPQPTAAPTTKKNPFIK